MCMDCINDFAKGAWRDVPFYIKMLFLSFGSNKTNCQRKSFGALGEEKKNVHQIFWGGSWNFWGGSFPPPPPPPPPLDRTLGDYKIRVLVADSGCDIITKAISGLVNATFDPLYHACGRDHRPTMFTGSH